LAIFGQATSWAKVVSYQVTICNTKTKIMKIKILLAAALMFTLFTQGQTKQDRQVADFTGIEVSGAFTVYLRMGDKCALTVIAKDDVLKKVKTQVYSGTLNIEMDQDWWDSNNDKVELYITVTTLRHIDLSGACVLKSKNTLRGTSLELDASGASKLELALQYNLLEASFSGATNVTLSGICTKVNIETSGASAIYGADLQAENMNLEVSGASKAEVNVAKQLAVEASGASKVRYKGNPSITQDVSGASSVQKL